MSKVKFIPCDIFKRGVHVFIGEPKEFENWIKQTYNEDEEEKAFAATFDGCFRYGFMDTHYGYGHTIIRMDKFPTEPKDCAAAGHEALHAADAILTYSGVEWYPNSNNETFTYLMEWILLNLLEDFGWEELDTKEEKK